MSKKTYFIDYFRRKYNQKLSTAFEDVFTNIRRIFLLRLQLEFQIPPIDDVSELEKKELVQSINTFFDWKLSSINCARSVCQSKYFDWLCDDAESMLLREFAFRIFHRYPKSKEDRDEIEQTFQAIFKRDLNPLIMADIWKMRGKTRRRYNYLRRHWDDSRGFKVSINWKYLASAIPIASALLVGAGYFHTSQVYEHFDIDPSSFFSVSDYLDSSLEQIYLVLWALIGATAGMINNYRRESLKTKIETEQETLHGKIVDFFWYAMSVCALLVSYFAWDRVAMLPAIGFILVICFLIVIRKPLSRVIFRFFKNPQTIQFASIALIIFFGNMYMGAKTEIAKIESEQASQEFWITSESRSYSHHNSKIIGANSTYMFILDRKERVEIVPISQIESAIFSRNRIIANNNVVAGSEGP